MSIINETLYKIDSKGKVRVWWIEYDAERYRTHSGLQHGKIVTSGWQYPTAKNVGRSNETSVAEQVLAEVEAEYIKKLNQGKYHKTVLAAEGGAKFHECMLAEKYNPKKHTNFPYYSQPKLDGIRCLVSKDGMQSRNGKPIVSSPHIMEALQPFFDEFPDVILDGELYNHSLRDNFEKIVSLIRKEKLNELILRETRETVQYHIYDVIFLDDKWEELGFGGRAQFLMDCFESETDSCIVRVPTALVRDKESLDGALSVYLAAGYEGQMLRVADAPYEGKRSQGLLKHKEFEDAEFEIVYIEEGAGNWAGYAKSVTIKLADGVVQSSGVRGNQEYLADILRRKDELIGTDVTVRYQNKTADGFLRFPVVTCFWEGKRQL